MGPRRADAIPGHTRRMSVMLRHLTPHCYDSSDVRADSSAALCGTALVPVPTNSMLATVAPMLALGAVAQYRARQSDKKSDDRELSKLDEVAEEHGFDSERLRQMETWATGLISSNKLPGIVIAVARRGQLVFHEAYGDQSFRKDSILSIGGMATPLITAAFLSLVDEGLVGIDDPVAKFLPYFANFRAHKSGKTQATLKTDPLVSPITIKHLLTHTWGFPGAFYAQSGSAETRFLDDFAAAFHPRVGHDEDFERLVQVPLIGQPGHCYRDGIASSVIGHIICCITGRHLPEVLHERLLDPLGMVDTDWFVPAEKESRVPSMYNAAPWLTSRLWGNRLTGEHAGHTSWFGWVAKESQRCVPQVLPAEISDQTSMYSTATDQLLFHSMLMSGGLASSGARVLSQESVRLMTTDQIAGFGHGLGDANFNSHSNDKANSSGRMSPQFGCSTSGQGNGLGMQVVTRPVNSRLAGSRGTFSSWSFGGVECWSDPALELSTFVGTQLSPFWALPEMRQEIAGAVYGSLVSTSAAKHLSSGQAEQGGAMGNMMNIMMLLSMLGGGGMMGRPGATGVAGGGGAAAAEGAGGTDGGIF